MKLKLIKSEDDSKLFNISQKMLDELFEQDLHINEIYTVLLNNYTTFHFLAGCTIKDWEEITTELAETFNKMGRP